MLYTLYSNTEYKAREMIDKICFYVKPSYMRLLHNNSHCCILYV